MKTVGKAIPDHNSALDAIESFKRRNIERNLQGEFKKETNKNNVQQKLKADNRAKAEEEEEEMHALEDFENLGNVINL